MTTRWRPWLGSGIVLLVCLMVGPVGSTDEGSDVAPSPAWDRAFRWNDYGLKEIPCSAEPCPFPSPYPPDAPLWMSPEDWEDHIRGMAAFDLSFGPVLDADNPVRVFVPEAFAGTVEVWWHRTGEAGWRVGETFRVQDRVLLALPSAGMEGEATYQVVVRTRNGVRWAVGPARTVWVGSMGTSRGSALIPQGFAPGPQGLAPMEASPSEAVQWVPASYMGGEEIRSLPLRTHTDHFWLGPGNTPIRVICDYERTAYEGCAISWYLFTMCNVRIVETRSGTHSICGQGQSVEEKFISYYKPSVSIFSSGV
jgi:hypothetical protein